MADEDIRMTNGLRLLGARHGSVQAGGNGDGWFSPSRLFIGRGGFDIQAEVSVGTMAGSSVATGRRLVGRGWSDG